MGSNKGNVTIAFTVPGTETTADYTGVIKGSTLEIDGDTQDNYFELFNGSVEVSCKNNTTGAEGTSLIGGYGYTTRWVVHARLKMVQEQPSGVGA